MASLWGQEGRRDVSRWQPSIEPRPRLGAGGAAYGCMVEGLLAMLRPLRHRPTRLVGPAPAVAATGRTR
eukprot:14564255-Alexandrium_andersonii.AAC.1